jgi:hypothetical protein
MKTIKLEDIPTPGQSAGNIALEIKPDIEQKVLERCEELGWLWYGIDTKATQVKFSISFPIWWLCLGYHKRKIFDKLFWDTTLEDDLIGLVPIEDQSGMMVTTYDLKTANSNPSATNCVKCGSKLKEPYPGLKHCPKCEP